MKLISQGDIDQYLKTDVIKQMLDDISHDIDEQLICQKWLRENPAKRFIFQDIYDDLINHTESLRVLDVGGGVTAFTKKIAQHHQLTLLDLMAHATANEMKYHKDIKNLNICYQDWFDFKPSGTYDIIIANDLFPNVDQRLELFLHKFLPYGNQIRLSITYYPDPKFYLTKRVNADEYLCMLAWNHEQTARTLHKFKKYICHPNFNLFESKQKSVYPNGRQVCLVYLNGFTAPKD